MPQYKVAVEKSRYAKIKDIVQSVARAQEVYYLANGKYAVRFDELDVNTPDGWTQGDRTSEELEEREWDWGTCEVRKDTALCRVGLSDKGTLTVVYLQYYLHISGSLKGVTRCFAYSTDLNSVANKVCQQDTQLSEPTGGGSGYKYWNYR